MNSTLSDHDLIIATLQNPHNYAYIVDKYEVPLLRYIRRIIGENHEISEDIAQEVFLKVYQKLNNYNPQLKFASWLYRIAHNLSIDHLRKHTKNPHISLDIEDEESQTLIQRLASDENVTLSFETQEKKKAVQIIIQSLSEKYKTVIILAFMEDKSYEEISDILQIPVGTVGTLINRAKKQFFALATEPQFSHLFSYVQAQ